MPKIQNLDDAAAGIIAAQQKHGEEVGSRWAQTRWAQGLEQIFRNRILLFIR